MTKTRLLALALAATAALACAPTAQAARRTYQLGYQAAQIAGVYTTAGVEAYGNPCPVQGIYVDVIDPTPGQRALASRGTQSSCVIHLNRKADFGRELCYAVVDVVARMNGYRNTQGNPTCEAQPRTAASRRRSSSRGRGH